MTNPSNSEHTAALRHAAERASLAPSVHNTQPWRFLMSGDCLELHADFGRHLQSLDPTSRQLYISCGCALLNLRAAMAADGREVRVVRFPDPDQPALLARICATGGQAEWTPLTRLDAQIERRRTNRRHFAAEPVPPEVRYELAQAVKEEDSLLVEITSDEQRATVAELSQRADAAQNSDPAYQSELEAWTTDDLKRRDGVPAMVVPHVSGDTGDEVPIRDFDTHGRGWLPNQTASSSSQYLLLLGSAEDTPQAWLRAGEALQRLWLEVTRNDLVASMLTQVVEVSETRDLLRRELGLTMFPHILLRVGQAPATPPVPRRGLDEMLVASD